MSKLKQRESMIVPEDQREAYDSIQIGMTLYGFCLGHFGRDSYGDKIVTQKSPSGLVVREKNGHFKMSTDMTLHDWNELVDASNSALEEEERTRDEDSE